MTPTGPEVAPMTELLPCPFCGEQPICEQDQLVAAIIYYCLCERCGFHFRGPMDYVVAAWNKRASPSEGQYAQSPADSGAIKLAMDGIFVTPDEAIALGHLRDSMSKQHGTKVNLSMLQDTAVALCMIIERCLKPSSPSEGQVQAMVAFLMGEGPFDGVWFGDKHPTEKGAFWWRKHLRAALTAGRG